MAYLNIINFGLKNNIMKARYDMYDRTIKPHAMQNWLTAFWLVMLTGLLFYTVFVLLTDNKRLNKDITYMSSEPRFCRSFVKQQETGMVTVQDSLGRLCCIFFDSTNLIEPIKK